MKGKFKKYDYGSKAKNLDKYGQEKPPKYELTNIKGIDMLLIGGKQDLLASEGDYCWLYQVLLCNNPKTILWNLNFGHCSLVYPEASRKGDKCD